MLFTKIWPVIVRMICHVGVWVYIVVAVTLNVSMALEVWGVSTTTCAFFDCSTTTFPLLHANLSTRVVATLIIVGVLTILFLIVRDMVKILCHDLRSRVTPLPSL